MGDAGWCDVPHPPHRPYSLQTLTFFKYKTACSGGAAETFAIMRHSLTKYLGTPQNILNRKKYQDNQVHKQPLTPTINTESKNVVKNGTPTLIGS